MRGRRLAALAGAVLAAQAAPACLAPAAGANDPQQLDPRGVAVAAYGGWAAWSRADAATGRFALVVRSPGGAISLPPVAESSVPFDVELGPASGSSVAAVYSRCAAPAAHAGCRLMLLELAAASPVERALSPPGGGSDHEPALWRASLVFLRRGSARAPGRPDRLLVWRIGSRLARELPLPSSRGNRGTGWPAGLTGRITGLGFNGTQVAYVTSNHVRSFGETTLWFEPLSGHPELIDQRTGGAGNVCEPEFLSPVLTGPWLYAYLHACDPSADPRLDRLTRYRRGEVQSARYTFITAGDEGLGSAVPDGDGVDWDATGIKRLAHVSWRRIAAPVAQTFCGSADPFC